MQKSTFFLGKKAEKGVKPLESEWIFKRFHGRDTQKMHPMDLRGFWRLKVDFWIFFLVRKRREMKPLNLSGFRLECFAKFHENFPKIPKCFQNFNLGKAKPIFKFKINLGVVGLCCRKNSNLISFITLKSGSLKISFRMENCFNIWCSLKYLEGTDELPG